MQFPQEYITMRTVLVRGLEWWVSERTKEEIKEHIESEYPSWELQKVVKIPNNNKLMKLVCKTAWIANAVMEKGITIFRQRFASKSLEKEMYISLNPCMQCYSYDHNTKKCKHPDDYLICSECAEKGHHYSNCKSLVKSVLTAISSTKLWHLIKCPIRKALVNKKIQELKSKTLDRVSETKIRTSVQQQIKEDLPENYITIVATAITLADVREKECPGTFQYILDQMYMANNLPAVKIPATVIAGYEHHRTKKRGRESSEKVHEEGGDDESLGTQSDL